MRIGILGAGEIACHHARVARALGHEVAAATARSQESANWAKFSVAAPGARFEASGQDLLEDPDLDAIVACLSWAVQPEWLGRLLASAKPVLLEKPIGFSPRQVRAALSASEVNAGNKLVGYNRRFYEPVRNLAERISQGGLKAVEVTISENVESHLKKHGPKVFEHILAFASCHSLDLVLYLLGPVTVASIKAYRETTFSVPFTSFNGSLMSAAGVPITLALNASDPSPAGFRCRFDDHTTWHLSPLEKLSIYEGYEVIEASESMPIRSYVPCLAESISADLRYKPGFLAQMEAFLSGKFGPGATVQDSVAVLDLIEALETSRP